MGGGGGEEAELSSLAPFADLSFGLCVVFK